MFAVSQPSTFFPRDSGLHSAQLQHNPTPRAQWHMRRFLPRLQLSCKMDREFRCVELAEMMPHNVLTLAIRYASRSRRMALAERLNELAMEKASHQEEQQQQEEEEVDPEYSRRRSG